MVRLGEVDGNTLGGEEVEEQRGWGATVMLAGVLRSCDCVRRLPGARVAVGDRGSRLSHTDS